MRSWQIRIMEILWSFFGVRVFGQSFDSEMRRSMCTERRSNGHKSVYWNELDCLWYDALIRSTVEIWLFAHLLVPTLAYTRITLQQIQ